VIPPLPSRHALGKQSSRYAAVGEARLSLISLSKFPGPALPSSATPISYTVLLLISCCVSCFAIKGDENEIKSIFFSPAEKSRPKINEFQIHQWDAKLFDSLAALK
jgi:hypothetical protein